MSDVEKKVFLLDLEDVKMKHINWLWPDRFQSEAINMLSGDQDVGKSTLALYVAAKVLAGGYWPFLPDTPIETGSVLILSTEDNISQVIKPKLEALAQELPRLPGNRVKFIEAVGVSKNGGPETKKNLTNLTKDADVLIKAIQQIGNVRLVIIDPITDFAGDKKANSNSDVREYLGKLRLIAEAGKLAIIGISHLNKDSQKRAAHRTLGSVAWTALPRSSWLVDYDAEDVERRYLLKQKCNGARKPLNAAFRLRSVTVTMPDGRTEGYPVCDFEAEPVSITADEVLDMDSRRKKVTKKNEAQDWLEKFLESGPKLAKEVKAAVSKCPDVSWSTIQKARTEMVKNGVMGVMDIRDNLGHRVETSWALLGQKSHNSKLS